VIGPSMVKLADWGNPIRPDRVGPRGPRPGWTSSPPARCAAGSRMPPRPAGSRPLRSREHDRRSRSCRRKKPHLLDIRVARSGQEPSIGDGRALGIARAVAPRDRPEVSDGTPPRRPSPQSCSPLRNVHTTWLTLPRVSP